MKKAGSRKKQKLRFFIVFSIIILIILFVSVFLIKNAKIKEEDIRKPAFAGTWYPANAEVLNNTINEYFQENRKINFDGRVKAIIVPHAGYVYSGKIAASAFNQLDEEYENVFLIGPSHNYPLENASISNYKYFASPLGNVKVSDKSKKMIKEEYIENIEEAHEKEHSLEIELPFLQKKLQDFEIVPILVGPTDSEKLKEILLKYLDEEDLIVVSADLSHYHENNEALLLDSYTLNKILELNSDGIMGAEIDAPWAVSTLLKIAEEKSWKPYIISYANSGDITGDKKSVVGYSAIIFVETFSEKEKEFLLKLARESATYYLKEDKELEIDENDVPENLRKEKGCFVTFTKDNSLRGCVGHILPQKPLYKCVIENAINAATKDSRFEPMEHEDLEKSAIDISVLSVPVLFEHNSPEELLSKLSEKEYGVVLRRGLKQSTFLPSVWEFIPEKQNFLSNLCIKGEMEAECWKDENTEVYLYTAEDFSE